jgi:hypothetical protein
VNERRRDRAEEARRLAERERMSRLEQRAGESATDVLDVLQPKTSVTRESLAYDVERSGTPAAREDLQSGLRTVAAVRPPVPAGARNPEIDRLGVNLRPVDRERWERFEIFCMRNHLRTGRKKGLTLYARAGLELLEALVVTDPDRAMDVLRRAAESDGRK